ncbi:MAG TPA: ABC transporter permease, partial [Thermoanaerobaculia bacterium]
IWPILLWSSLGNREARHATSELVFSAAWPIRRQLPATWAAGFLLAIVTGIGVGVRLAVAGDWPALGAWAVGAAFIPTLALAMGVWSGTSRPFEAVYLALWYIGPLQRVAALDFMGAVPEGVNMGVPVAYLVATVALGVAAVAGRRRWFGVG